MTVYSPNAEQNVYNYDPLTMSPEEFIHFASVYWDLEIPDFSTPSQVYPISNFKILPSEIEKIEKAELNSNDVMISVIGGSDMALTYFAASGLDRLYLFDCNPYSCDFCNYKLNLIAQCKSVEEYLQRFMPQGFSTEELVREYSNFCANSASDRNFLAKVAVTRLYSGLSFQGNFDFFYDSVRSAELSRQQRMRVMSVYQKLSWLNDKYEPEKMSREVIQLLADVLSNDKHWLYLQDQTRYQEIRKKVLEGKIKVFHSPIQTLLMSPLFRYLESTKQKVGLFFPANALQYISGPDYDELIRAMKSSKLFNKAIVPYVATQNYDYWGLTRLRRMLRSDRKKIRLLNWLHSGQRNIEDLIAAQGSGLR